MDEIPVCYLIWENASSIMFTFLMYISIKFFFSLLLFVHFWSLSFKSATGLENSPAVTAVVSYKAAPSPLVFDFCKSESSLSFNLSYRFLIFTSKLNFSASCFAFNAKI